MITEGLRETRVAATLAMLTALGLGGEIYSIEGFFDVATRIEGENLNTPSQEQSPVLSADRRELHFSSDRQGSWDIWVASRDSVAEPFESPRSLEINTEWGEDIVCLSHDRRTLYFSSDRPGGEGSWDIWVATRDSAAGRFGEPRNLEVVNTPAEESFGGSVTQDHLELYFDTHFPGVTTKLFVSRRAPGRRFFGPPTEIAELNTHISSNPSISPDGLVLFFNSYNRPGGLGNHDIYIATRAGRVDDAGNRVRFGPPENLGDAINSDLFDAHANITCDWPRSGATFCFSRGVPGADGLPLDADLWWTTWHADCNRNGVDDDEDIATRASEDSDGDGTPDECQPVSFLRADCNDDGTVDISDAVCALEWLFLGSEAPGCIAALNTNGDEDVDIADPVYSLWFSFLGGPAPVEPYPDCGPGTLPGDEGTCETPPKSCQQ